MTASRQHQALAEYFAAEAALCRRFPGLGGPAEAARYRDLCRAAVASALEKEELEAMALGPAVARVLGRINERPPVGATSPRAEAVLRHSAGAEAKGLAASSRGPIHSAGSA